MPSRLVMRMGVRVAIVAVQTPGHHAALGNRRLLHGALAQACLCLATLHLPPLGRGVDELSAATPHRGAAVSGVAASTVAVVIGSACRVPSVPMGSSVFAVVGAS